MNNSSEEVRIEDKTNSNSKAYLIVLLAFLVSFIGNYPQFQLAPLSNEVISIFNLTPAQFSSVFSGSMVPGILLSLISGLLCDRVGVKKSISFAGVIAAIGTILRVWSFNYITLLVCMMLSGLGSTFINSNVSKLLSKWFEPEQLGPMMGLVLAGTATAQALGMLTTAYFPSVKSAYVFAAVISVLIAIAWILFAKEAPSNINNTLSQEAPKQSLMESIKVVISNKYIWCIGVALFFMMGSIIAISSFMPLALQNERGLSAQAAGGMTSVMLIGSLVGTVVGPILCEKSGNIKMYIFASAVIAGIGTALAWKLSFGIIMISVMFITGFTSSSMIPIMLSLPIRLKGIGFEIAGTAGGVVATIQLMGAVVIPTYIIIPIAGSNFTLFFVLAGISAALCGVIALILPNFKNQ